MSMCLKTAFIVVLLGGAPFAVNPGFRISWAHPAGFLPRGLVADRSPGEKSRATGVGIAPPYIVGDGGGAFPCPATEGC